MEAVRCYPMHLQSVTRSTTHSTRIQLYVTVFYRTIHCHWPLVTGQVRASTYEDAMPLLTDISHTVEDVQVSGNGDAYSLAHTCVNMHGRRALALAASRSVKN